MLPFKKVQSSHHALLVPCYPLAGGSTDTFDTSRYNGGPEKNVCFQNHINFSNV